MNVVPSTITRLRPSVALFMRMYRYLMHRRSIIINEKENAAIMRIFQNFMNGSPVINNFMTFKNTKMMVATITNMKTR